ncbi:MAG: septation ring formation regulator EzrA [Erysipelotrichaceae bacterium]|nr:septation ring formation regulator EzrA [Erysipelotrichaceae bacterium]MDD4643112.1 septation ring formation regulator EzrA [Erysipelotrichaceae bacterium]
MDFESILAFLLKKEVIITLVVIFLFTVFLLIKRKGKIKRLRKTLADYEIKYNSIKSVPLSFKLNKAVALAKVDESIIDTINEYKDQFDHIHVNLKEITSMLTDMEDHIISGNLKKADLNAIDLSGMIERAFGEVNKLDTSLDLSLQQEVMQRDKINQFKEQFRELKNIINQNPEIFEFTSEKINKDVKRIENAFSEFEELMYVSDFNKANDVMVQLDNDINDLKILLEDLPELLKMAKGIVPQLIDKVSQTYSLCKQKGLYLQHLDVARNIELITETLKQDLSQLRLGNTNEVQKDLEEYQTRLTQLINQIEREDSAHNELYELKTSMFDLVDKTNDTLDYVGKLYVKASDRYGFENIEDTLNEYQVKINELGKIKSKLNKLVEENTVPASTILISLKEFEQEITELSNKVNELRSQLDSIRKDEERAKKQLLKLYLIVNEIQVKIRKHRLPEISDQYEGDLRKANEYLKTLTNLLNEDLLNNNLLSSTLQEAIDFIYLLYNNVNNLVGMALMVENTIVFGNKYRSTYPEVDSELIRAELNFRNGEYTQALSIAMNAIERLNLEGYQQQIKENAISE